MYAQAAMKRRKHKQMSQARLAANRANALKSTGPKTPEGKAASSQNATTHGLTSKRLASSAILEGESQEEFDALLTDYTSRFRPADPLETRMVLNIAQLDWQIRRYRRIEESLLEIEMADPLCGILTGLPMQETAGCYKMAKAFEQLAERRSLQLANRIISRLTREHTLAMKFFIELRKNVPVVVETKVQIEPNPVQDFSPRFAGLLANQTQSEPPPQLQN